MPAEASQPHLSLLEALPNELLLCIADYLPQSDLNAICKTSWNLRHALLDYLYDHNIKYFKSSAFIWAAEHGAESVARDFVVRKGHSSFRDYEHRFALMEAVVYGQQEMISLFLDLSMVHHAGFEPHSIEYRFRLGWALQVAVLFNHQSVCRILLEHSVRVDAREYVVNGPALFEVMKQNSIPLARLFVQFGADVNSKDQEGATLILYALRHGRKAIPMVVFLVMCGADINAEVSSQPILLHVIIRFRNMDTAATLVNLGADITKPGIAGRTALEWAIHFESLSLVKLLLRNNADVEKEVIPPGGCHLSNDLLRVGDPMRRLLLDHIDLEKYLHADFPEKPSLLKLAAISGYYPAVRDLLEAGCPADITCTHTVDQTPKEFPTALYHAAQGGHYDVVNLLLSYGAHPDAHLQVVGLDGLQGSPLLAAVYRGQRHRGIIERLLDSGADICHPSILDENRARMAGEDTLNIFLSRGVDPRIPKDQALGETQDLSVLDTAS